MTEFHLMDLDNRDEDWTPFAFTGDAEKVIAYLDGPLRRDTLSGSVWKVNAAIDLLRAGETQQAIYALAGLGVRLTTA